MPRRKKDLKLKGTIVEHLSKEDKEKKEKTLAKMQETREQDDIWLRDLLKQKIAWAINEKTKGEKLLKDTQTKVNRLEGIILLIQDVLGVKKETASGGK
jgi:hypothetical protein